MTVSLQKSRIHSVVLVAGQVELTRAIYSPSRRRELPCLKERSLLVAVGDAAPREVVRGDLHDDPVTREDADVVHPDLARDGAEDGLSVLELNVEHGVGQGLDDLALKLDCVLLAQSATLSYKR